MPPCTLKFNKNLFIQIRSSYRTLTVVRRTISIVILTAFVATSIKAPAYAQAAPGSPRPWMSSPGVMVHLSPEFTPAHLKGIVIHPENALKFDFIIYKGDQQLTDKQKREEYTKLTKYFLASLAVPDEDQWVNLSPYEKDRIIKDDFGKTEMGRDLLAQDYMLKQITASLIYPEDNLGKKFWDKVYTQAQQQFGTTNIPVNTFNKVWILPDDAMIYEKGNTAYVIKNHLKVMLEEDYLALDKHSGIQSAPVDNKTHSVASKVVREIVLPALEREVNEGKNFAPLRQVYSGMLLAAWYKRALKESLLSKIYANQSKVKGVEHQNPQANQEIYQQYLKAYKKGVFNFIKEDVNKLTKESIPRKYFSGGTRNILSEKEARDRGVPGLRTKKALEPGEGEALAGALGDSDFAAIATVEENEKKAADAAMKSIPDLSKVLQSQIEQAVQDLNLLREVSGAKRIIEKLDDDFKWLSPNLSHSIALALQARLNESKAIVWNNLFQDIEEKGELGDLKFNVENAKRVNEEVFKRVIDQFITDFEQALKQLLSPAMTASARADQIFTNVSATKKKILKSRAALDVFVKIQTEPWPVGLFDRFGRIETSPIVTGDEIGIEGSFGTLVMDQAGFNRFYGELSVLNSSLAQSLDAAMTGLQLGYSINPRDIVTLTDFANNIAEIFVDSSRRAEIEAVLEIIEQGIEQADEEPGIAAMLGKMALSLQRFLAAPDANNDMVELITDFHEQFLALGGQLDDFAMTAKLDVISVIQSRDARGYAGDFQESLKRIDAGKTNASIVGAYSKLAGLLRNHNDRSADPWNPQDLLTVVLTGDSSDEESMGRKITELKTLRQTLRGKGKMSDDAFRAIALLISNKGMGLDDAIKAVEQIRDKGYEERITATVVLSITLGISLEQASAQEDELNKQWNSGVSEQFAPRDRRATVTREPLYMSAVVLSAALRLVPEDAWEVTRQLFYQAEDRLNADFETMGTAFFLAYYSHLTGIVHMPQEQRTAFNTSLFVEAAKANKELVKRYDGTFPSAEGTSNNPPYNAPLVALLAIGDLVSAAPIDAAMSSWQRAAAVVALSALTGVGGKLLWNNHQANVQQEQQAETTLVALGVQGTPQQAFLKNFQLLPKSNSAADYYTPSSTGRRDRTSLETLFGVRGAMMREGGNYVGVGNLLTLGELQNARSWGLNGFSQAIYFGSSTVEFAKPGTNELENLAKQQLKRGPLVRTIEEATKDPNNTVDVVDFEALRLLGTQKAALKNAQAIIETAKKKNLTPEQLEGELSQVPGFAEIFDNPVAKDVLMMSVAREVYRYILSQEGASGQQLTDAVNYLVRGTVIEKGNWSIRTFAGSTYITVLNSTQVLDWELSSEGGFTKPFVKAAIERLGKNEELNVKDSDLLKKAGLGKAKDKSAFNVIAPEDVLKAYAETLRQGQEPKADAAMKAGLVKTFGIAIGTLVASLIGAQAQEQPEVVTNGNRATYSLFSATFPSIATSNTSWDAPDFRGFSLRKTKISDNLVDVSVVREIKGILQGKTYRLDSTSVALFEEDLNIQFKARNLNEFTFVFRKYESDPSVGSFVEFTGDLKGFKAYINSSSDLVGPKKNAVVLALMLPDGTGISARVPKALATGIVDSLIPAAEAVREGKKHYDVFKAEFMEASKKAGKSPLEVDKAMLSTVASFVATLGIATIAFIQPENVRATETAAASSEISQPGNGDQELREIVKQNVGKEIYVSNFTYTVPKGEGKTIAKLAGPSARFREGEKEDTVIFTGEHRLSIEKNGLGWSIKSLVNEGALATGQFVNVTEVTINGKRIQRFFLSPKSADPAALSNPLGGIDFNAANLNLQIKRDGLGVPLPINQQNLENIHIDGLIPVILDIRPVASTPLLSELISPQPQLLAKT